MAHSPYYYYQYPCNYRYKTTMHHNNYYVCHYISLNMAQEGSVAWPLTALQAIVPMAILG